MFIEQNQQILKNYIVSLLNP